MTIPDLVHKEVDASGLNCPLPILRAKKALADMQSGEVLKITATDGGSSHDFPTFAKQTGNELIASENLGEAFVFYLKRR
jgi:tRNA 2-thiouridine synthesizing protein A